MKSLRAIFPRETGIGILLLWILAAPFLSSAVIRFTEVSTQSQVRGYGYFGGHGAAWVDVNKDGLLDLFVKNVGAQGVLAVSDILYINYGGYFVDEAFDRGVTDAYAIGTHGAVFCDWDSDGDYDLFSTTTYDGISPAYNHLYRNDGGGYFQDVTSAISPSQSVDTASRGVAAADFDGDGDIDLFFTNPLPDPLYFNPTPSPPQQLENFYMNNGDGTFNPAYRGIDWTGFVQGVTAADIDGDGDIDIAEAKWGPPSTIYLNDGKGNFSDAGAILGLPQTHDVRDNGIIFADVDNDEDLDMAVIGVHRLALYENRDNLFFEYQTIALQGAHEGFHSCFGDFDHDGDVDLYISGEDVFENDGLGLFTLVLTELSGLAASKASTDPRGGALGDFDGDGDLDIYITDKRGYNLLLRNDIDDTNWIQVIIPSTDSGSLGGLGLKFDLYLAGFLDQPQFLQGHREIQGEYGYLGQDMPFVHFGTPAANRYDLKVTFPDGTKKVLKNLAAGEKVRLIFIKPPLNFTAVMKENRALFYRESFIVLKWNENPENEDVQTYRIYTVDAAGNFTLQDEVDWSTFDYMIRHVDKGKAHRFALIAVDSRGNESEPVRAEINPGGTGTKEEFGGKSTMR